MLNVFTLLFTLLWPTDPNAATNGDNGSILDPNG